jgi:hypothetical protein
MDLGRHSGDNIAAAKGIIPEAKLKTLTQTAQTQAPTQTTPPKQVEPIKVDTPFGTQIIGSRSSEDTVVELRSIDDVVSAISKETGVELKDFNDVMSKVINPFKTLKGDMIKVPELESRVNTLSEVIQAMPEDLAKVFYKYINNEDYQSAMSNVVLAKTMDFGKDFSQQDEVRMINHYSGQNFSKDTLDGLDPSVKSSLVMNAKRLYDIDKSQQTVKPDVSKKINERQQAFIDSIKSSINTLRATYPDMSPDKVHEVEATLMTKAGKRLFDSNGLYKPTAAVDISMMLYGGEAISVQKATIQEIMQATMEQGKTIATEEILLRNDKPSSQNMGGAGTPGQDISQKVKQSTSFLRKGGIGEQF